MIIVIVIFIESLILSLHLFQHIHILKNSKSALYKCSFHFFIFSSSLLSFSTIDSSSSTIFVGLVLYTTHSTYDINLIYSLLFCFSGLCTNFYKGFYTIWLSQLVSFFLSLYVFFDSHLIVVNAIVTVIVCV